MKRKEKERRSRDSTNESRTLAFLREWRRESRSSVSCERRQRHSRNTLRLSAAAPITARRRRKVLTHQGLPPQQMNADHSFFVGRLSPWTHTWPGRVTLWALRALAGLCVWELGGHWWPFNDWPLANAQFQRNVCAREWILTLCVLAH